MKREKRKPLTEYQKRVLALIKERPNPTFGELAAMIGRTENAARQHVEALERKGYIAQRLKHKHRQIMPVNECAA